MLQLRNYRSMGLIMAVEADKIPKFRQELASLINETWSHVEASWRISFPEHAFQLIYCKGLSCQIFEICFSLLITLLFWNDCRLDTEDNFPPAVMLKRTSQIVCSPLQWLWTPFRISTKLTVSVGDNFV